MAHLVAVLLSLASIVSEAHVVVSNRKIVPSPWRHKGRAAATRHMRIAFAVRQQNVAALEEHLQQVSSPGHPRYRHFMSKGDIHKVIQIPKYTEEVKSWLYKVLPDATVEDRGDAVVLPSIAVKDVEVLFRTKVHTFVGPHFQGMELLRSFGSVSIPKRVHTAIDFVEGLYNFPRLPRATALTKKMQRGLTSDAGDWPNVVPQTLYSTYNLPSPPLRGNTTQTAVTFNNWPAPWDTDLEQFFQGTTLPSQKITKHIGRGNPPTSHIDFFVDEQSLDVQYLAASGLGVENWFWTTPSWMFTFASDLFKADVVPTVVSISYGWDEDAQCIHDDAPDKPCKDDKDSRVYVERVNVEFMKIGLRGVSLVVASGDSGANDGHCDKLRPVFPAASPYVTTVGATEFVPNASVGFKDVPVCKNFTCATGGHERAVSVAVGGFSSGGGFSFYADQPQYQLQAVREYLEAGSRGGWLPNTSLFNSSKRAYPDVAALGTNFLTRLNGKWVPLPGTSASCPAWAGVASRLNSLAMSCNGKPLGFLNPLLYKVFATYPEAFFSITEGDNSCTFMSGCPDYGKRCQGFNATAGWNPVTGLGTPNFPVLWEAIQTIVGFSCADEVPTKIIIP